MKNIGDTLKKLREENGMTRKDAADKLKSLGIDISDKTLYGYESGRNSANADMFLALCKIYECNNIMGTFSETVEDILFTNNEWNMVEKYRLLDQHGKEMTDFVLNKEYDRCQAIQQEKVATLSKKPTRPIPTAAHADDSLQTGYLVAQCSINNRIKDSQLDMPCLAAEEVKK